MILFIHQPLVQMDGRFQMIDMDKVFSGLFTATRQAGSVAKLLQSGIVNEGKTADSMCGDTDHIAAQRQAKSLADDVVQEILLNSLIEIPGCRENLSLDAEEDSPTVGLFRREKPNHNILVIDPIDGTYEYCMQEDSYSICSTVIADGAAALAIIFFPARDTLYYYSPGSPARVLHNASTVEAKESKLLYYPLPAKAPKAIYKNSRVPKESVLALESLGFEVIDDAELGCPDAIIECIEGRALAYISHSRNIRDIVLGAIISKMKDGQALDWSGNDLIWNHGGRQPRAVFSRFDIPSEVFDCLRGK
jgi:fructose-1,6-bisphosphatase/inositol monophosphatase family enzyme